MALIPRLRASYSLTDLAVAFFTNAAGDRERFEGAFAAAFEFPHALLFPYGRGALFELMKVLQQRDREVLCPAYTCVVVPHAVKLAGHRVRFADSSPDHFLVPADEWRRQVTPSTALAIMTPLFGYPIDKSSSDAVVKSAAPNAFLLYDVAQGYATTDDAGLQTTHADAALFSLGVGKMMTTLYGGILALRDSALYRELKDLRDRKFSTPGVGRRIGLTAYGAAIWAAFRQPFLTMADFMERHTDWLYSFTSYYYATDRPRLPADVETMPTALQARLGLCQLDQYKGMAAERRSISQWYEERLQAEGFSTFPFRTTPTWSIYPLAVADRKSVVDALHRRGVQVGVLNDYCCADLPGYEVHFGSCPNAARWGRSMINLPNWPGLGLVRAQRVMDALLRCRDVSPRSFVTI